MSVVQPHLGRSADQAGLDTIIDAAKKVKRHGQPLSADPVIRQKLAQAYIRVDVMRFNNYRSITNQLRGQPPGPEASLERDEQVDAGDWPGNPRAILTVGSRVAALSDVGEFAAEFPVESC